MTLDIEKALAIYDPALMCGIKINKFRDRHTAFEVPAECGSTLFGIVDCIGICEYFDNIQEYRSCYWHINKKHGMRDAERDCLKAYPPGKKPPRCGEHSCLWNRATHEGEPKILITCYEIKVTKADFKSKNGHNFIGNLNYYVVPHPIYPEIKKLVPGDIGIIVFYDGTQPTTKPSSPWPVTPYRGLRRRKECIFRELSDEAQKWLVLSVLKRARRTPYIYTENQNFKEESA
jgi:hypothetical protein